MFSPGHLHCTSLPGQPEFSVDLRYEVRQDTAEGPMLHCELSGSIEGKPFEEQFELHRDLAANFASVATRKLIEHGLKDAGNYFLKDHREFDRMFEDIRSALQAHSGDSVDLDHLEKDGL